MTVADLPRLSAIRPRAKTASDGAAVEVRFENGTKIRYRGEADGIHEEWFDATADEPVRSHPVTGPVAHGADGQASGDMDGRPDTRTLSDRALCTVASYLDFESRTEAEFAWGEANVAVLCDDASSL